MFRVSLRCFQTHLRIMFMVSLRSFPWNGNVPVSISNCKHKSRKWNKQDFTAIDFYLLGVCVWVGSTPWVLPKTTSLHSVCVLSCWPPQGPYTPPYHRRNKPSYQHPPTLYSGQSLCGSKENGRVKPWRVKLQIVSEASYLLTLYVQLHQVRCWKTGRCICFGWDWNITRL